MAGLELVERLARFHDLSDDEFLWLLQNDDPKITECLAQKGGETARRVFGARIFIRGLIEISNICVQDCLYCGIRRSNHKAERYRLSAEDILGAAETGYKEGFRTFVLQGGEDPFFTDAYLEDLIRELKRRFPDAAVTLSLGQRPRESYARLKAAGADRYLLRHETADAGHFASLHPPSQTLASRLSCLRDLRELGFQAGLGFMLGSPGQSPETLLEDLRLVQSYRPHMIGIGPFIPHEDTPFREEKPGSAEQTVKLLAILRLMDPRVLLPATTALATLGEDGRKRGIAAGANVVMPNLSPPGVREKYALYRKKAIWGSEAAEHLDLLQKELDDIGYEIEFGRGDSLLYEEEARTKNV